MKLINYSKNTQHINECLDEYDSINEILTFYPIFYDKRKVTIRKSSTFSNNSDHFYVYRFHLKIMSNLKFINLDIKELETREEEIFSYEIFQKFGPQFLNIMTIQNFFKSFSKKEDIYLLADCEDGKRIFNFLLANNFNIKLIYKKTTSFDKPRERNIIRGIKIILSNIIYFNSKIIFNQSPNKFENLIASLQNYKFFRKDYKVESGKKRYAALSIKTFNHLDFHTYNKEIERHVSAYFPVFSKIKIDLLKNFSRNTKYFTSQNTTPFEIVKNILLGDYAKVFFYYDGSGIIDESIYDIYKYTIPRHKKINKLFWSQAQSINAKVSSSLVIGCLGLKKLTPIDNITNRNLVLVSLTSADFKRSLPVIQKTTYEMLSFLKDIAKASEMSNFDVLIKLHPSDYSNLKLYKKSLIAYQNISFILQNEKIPFKNILVNITFDTTMNISTIHEVPYQIIYNQVNRPNLSTFFKQYKKVKNFFFIEDKKSLTRKLLQLKQSFKTYNAGKYEYILENFSDHYETKLRDIIKEN